MADARFFINKGPLYIEDVLSLCAATCTAQGVEKRQIHDVATLEDAGPTDVACFHNRAYLEAFKKTRAGFCFVPENLASFAPQGLVTLVTPTPYRDFGLVGNALYPDVDRNYEAGDQFIHPEAVVEEGCVIECGALIQRGAHVGAGTRIGSGAVVGKGVVVGKNCLIEPGVTLSHCLIEDNVTLSAGVRIGQAGFGFFMDEKGHVKVPQLGRVLIGTDVEIGAGTTIDRGSLQDTVIGRGCRLDNLVQIAHNVRLGRGCVIVAQVGIAGSAQLGDYVVVAGQVGIAGHLKIGKGVRIAAQSGLMRDVEDGQTIAGSPAVPVRQFHRQTAMLAKLAKKD